MRATRLTQPYRRSGSRQASPALQAMLRGRDFQGGNPQDLQRSVQRLLRAGKSKTQRPVRPERPARPTR